MAGGSKSKNKGSGAERELCKFFQDTFGGSFIRSSNSGAFVGGLNAARKANLSKTQIAGQKGDIIPPDTMPRFVIESKFYKDFRFHQLLQPGPCVQLEEWIKQCKDATDEGDFWIIGFKINLRGWFILIPDAFEKQFKFENYSVYVGGAYGRFLVTDLKSFCTTNRAKILKLTA